MRKIHIIVKNFLTDDERVLSVGGIQSYISELSRLLFDNGYAINIYQFSRTNFTQEYQNTTVFGIQTDHIRKWSKKKKAVVEFCLRYFDNNSDLLLFSCDSLITKNTVKNSIAIQHGISWDVIRDKTANFFYGFLYSYLKAYKRIRNYKYVNKIVSVDYNFLNWIRAALPMRKYDIVVIPNAFLTNNNEDYGPEEKDMKKIKIIFARRFVPLRGTRLMANVVLKMLKEFNHIEITFAGEGPDEIYLKRTFENYENVHFIKFDQSETLRIHSSHHVAVVPSIGSEGTSLSLIEAMYAKCAVVATNVGGITNIIINGYNGILIDPEESQLYWALIKLVESKKLRDKLSQKAYDTVCESFSAKRWNDSWLEVMNKFFKDEGKDW